MRLASSSFMYQGETMGSGISWDLYVPATGKIPVAASCNSSGRRREASGPRSKQLRLPRKPAQWTLKERAGNVRRPGLNLSAKYWTFPVAHRWKTSRPVRGPLVYRARRRVIIAAKSYEHRPVVCRCRSCGVRRAQTSSLTRTRPAGSSLFREIWIKNNSFDLLERKNMSA